MTAQDGIARPDPDRGKKRDDKDGLAPATRVTLDRTDSPPTTDERLWNIIRDRTDALAFNNYKRFIDTVEVGGQLFRGVEAYSTLKTATRAWLQYEAGVWLLADPSQDPVASRFLTGDDDPDDNKKPARGKTAPSDPTDEEDVRALRDEYLAELDGDLKVLPYHKLIVDSLGVLPLKPAEVVFGAYGISPAQLFRPVMLELIWSYWHEEGMLVQAMNAISRRFQNRRTARSGTDPLFRLELDPLRTVNNLIWGYVQDEWNLLTVQRRAYEYQHEYGISLLGKAIPGFDPADSRPRFLTAFHDLLLACATFYEADDDTTVVADAFARPQRAQGCAPDPRGGGAQPVRRPGVDGPVGDADPAVDPQPARVSRVPRRPHDGRVPGAVDGSRRLDAPDARLG